MSRLRVPTWRIMGIALAVGLSPGSVGVAQSPAPSVVACLGPDAAPPVALASMAGPDPGPLTVTSDDGKLTLELAEGAVPVGTIVSATFQSPECRPPELADVRFRNGFYALRPAGLELAVPGRVTRSITADELGIDISGDTPLIALANRLADGTWSWLDALDMNAQNDTGLITLAGSVSVLGDVYGFSTGDGLLLAADPPDLQVQVGSAATISVTLHGPAQAQAQALRGVGRGARATGLAIAGAGGPLLTGGEPFVDDGDVVVVVGPAVDGLTYQGSYRCDAVGSTRVGADLTLSGLGEGSGILDSLSLPTADMDAYAGVQMTCLEATSAVRQACISVTHEALRRFLSYVELLAYLSLTEIVRYEITITGANDDKAVKGKVRNNVIRAKLGINDVSPKTIKKVVAITSGGERIDITDDVLEHVPEVFTPTYPAENDAGDGCA